MNLGKRISSACRTGSHTPTTGDTVASGEPFDAALLSKTLSSGELFGMLKALAAGKAGSKMMVEPELDDEEDMYSTSSHTSETTTGPPSPDEGSMGDAVLDEDGGIQITGDDSVALPLLSPSLSKLALEGINPLGQAALQTPARPILHSPLSMKDIPTLAALKLSSSPKDDTPASSAPDTPVDLENWKFRSAAIYGENEPSVEDKLKAIKDEFGDIAPLTVNEDPERLLAEASGSLFRGVMVVGNLHLTTHRLIFHAILPPDSALIKETPHEFAKSILRAGPVTLHYSSQLKQPRRLWLELTPDLLTTFPRGDEAGRVRPIRSISLASVRKLEALDPTNPCEFHITYDREDGVTSIRFTVDTEQSAVNWRRTLEAALFRHVRIKWRSDHAFRQGGGDDLDQKWSMLRCCLPLDRITIRGIEEYHSFSTIIGMDVRNAESRQLRAALRGDLPFGGISSEIFKDSPVRRSFSLKSPFRSRQGSREASPSRGASTPTRRTSQHPEPVKKASLMDASVYGTVNPPPSHTPPETENAPRTVPFNVAVLNDLAWFAEALNLAVSAAQHRRYRPDVTPPELNMSLGGYDCLTNEDDAGFADEETQVSSSAPSEEHLPEDLPDSKAHKAALAAKVFGIKAEESIWLKRCYISGHIVPARGHIIVSKDFICFWRRALVGADIKYRFRCSDVKGAIKSPPLRSAFCGMSLQVHGQHDLLFEFWHESARDEVIMRINQVASGKSKADSSPSLATPTSEASETVEETGTEVSFEGHVVSEETRWSPTLIPKNIPGGDFWESTTNPSAHAADILAPPREALFQSKEMTDDALAFLPFVANKPWNATAVKLKARTFALLTIGSRGDIQPYIALGLRLMKDGHKVVIVTHNEFKKWVEGYGIEHRQAGGDPTALMKLSAEHKMFSPGFFKETLGSFRQWLDDLLIDSWNSCQGADVLIESPSTMAGIHIAEALRIPYFRAFTMPWTRTSAYPQAFMVPSFEMGPSFNYSTYVLFDNILWTATSGQINNWRKKHLLLKATDQSSLSVSKVPFLYNFSPAVVPKPLDWHDDIYITGYWTLEDSDTDWTPPPSLDEFLTQAKADEKPVVYIGFGSIVVPHPNALTKSIIKAVEKSNVRAIIAKGWSSRGGDPKTEGEDIVFTENCYGLDKVPHGWLFPKIQAAMHHGGAGTVGASLRAGIPTLIRPWFGDQFFWANRVTKLGAGMKVASLKSDDIAAALIKATTDRVMIEKAAQVGSKIRQENGVEVAVQFIQHNISRAASDRTTMKWAK